MKFIPYEPLDKNKAQKHVWSRLKELFKNTGGGTAFYRYPIFTKMGEIRSEPDILILHRKLGILIIECKGCVIGNIADIQGHEWTMRNWYKETMTPVIQAEDQMYAVKNKLDGLRETRNLMYLTFKVALPFVKRNEWKNRGFSSEEVILYGDDLTLPNFRKIVKNSQQNMLTDEQWEPVKNVIGGRVISRVPPRSVPTTTPKESPVRIIHKIESEMAIMDGDQQKIAYEVPPGPQRIRGLAGTGKTVLFAKRAAKMHAEYPDWDIAFVFFTRALYGQIKNLVTRYYCGMTGEEPDWKKLRVFHSWGARDQPGFYRSLALKCGVKPKSLNDITRDIGSCSPSKAFGYACNHLEKEVSEFPEIYDAILIDEGQDLPPAFYRNIYKSLKHPKRLYWAYDEAQGIGSLIVPRSKEIFGIKQDGTPVVDLGGNKHPDGTVTPPNYDSNIAKAHNLKQCYRTPRRLLMAAHAVNMGLYRDGGALQGVTRKNEWESLGYKIIGGDFSSASVSQKKLVKITRADDDSPHVIDRNNVTSKSLLYVKTFRTEDLEREWIAEQVADDLKQGLKPEDILITGPSGDYEKDYFKKLKKVLEQRRGVRCCIAGVDTDSSTFRLQGHVTIATIFRAKGNEAWKVYVCRFNYAIQPLIWKIEEELHKRNEAFTAITRSRLWCVITGLNSPIFQELENINNDHPYLIFPAFDQSSVKNNEEEITQV